MDVGSQPAPPLLGAVKESFEKGNDAEFRNVNCFLRLFSFGFAGERSTTLFEKGHIL